MKIQLERKFTYCPDHLTCSVCCQSFPVPAIRSLLFTDSGLLQGDICSNCYKLGSDGIQQTLRDRAILLKKHSEFYQSNTIAVHQRATELMTCAQERVKFPPLFQWCLKWWEFLTAETVELETTRLQLSDHCTRRVKPNLLPPDLQWPEAEE
jgi:hypothetical protein